MSAPERLSPFYEERARLWRSEGVTVARIAAKLCVSRECVAVIPGLRADG